jgi:hypothetical protein
MTPYRIEEYRNQYGQWCMKIFVNNSCVMEGIYDEFKIKLVENIFTALGCQK